MDLDDLDPEQLRRRRGEKWRTYPDHVLPAWVADMDFPLAAPLQDYLREIAETTDLGYPINPTTDALPTVFAKRVHERFGWSIDPRDVVVLTDVVQGMYIALWTLGEPGDAAVVQTPVYPPFLECVAEVKRRQVTNELVRGTERYEIDFDALRRDVDTQTRALLLCNPQNPTGRTFTRSELTWLAELAIERDLTVIADEIHADLVFPGFEHLPMASLGPEIAERTITLMSASKAFNIAGARCAVAHFGSRSLRKRFESIPGHIRGGLSSLGLQTTTIAWTQCQPWLDQVLAYLDGNRRRVEAFVHDKLPGVEMLTPEATYLAWLDCRELGLENPWRFFYERGQVALSQGSGFGRGGQGFVRLNFATSRGVLDEILERLASALASR
jgi:cystathionine beta-lyase